MPISVVCGDCDKKYNVKDEMAGKKFRCKACQSVISVPGGDPDDDPFGGMDLKSSGRAVRRRDDDDDQDDGDDDDFEKPRRRVKSSKTKSRSKRRASGGGMPPSAIVAIICQSIITLLRTYAAINSVLLYQKIPTALLPPNIHARIMGELFGDFFRIAVAGAVLAGLLRRSGNARQWSRGLCVLATVVVGIAVVIKISQEGAVTPETSIMLLLISLWATIIVCLSTSSADDWFNQ